MISREVPRFQTSNDARAEIARSQAIVREVEEALARFSATQAEIDAVGLLPELYLESIDKTKCFACSKELVYDPPSDEGYPVCFSCTSSDDVDVDALINEHLDRGFVVRNDVAVDDRRD